MLTPIQIDELTPCPKGKKGREGSHSYPYVIEP